MYVYHIVTTVCNIASMDALRDYYSSAVLVLCEESCHLAKILVQDQILVTF